MYYIFFSLCCRIASGDGLDFHEIDDGGEAICADGCTNAKLHLRLAQHPEQASASSRP